MRSNWDLYMTMGFSILILILMGFFVYDAEATANLGLVIPLLCFVCGYMFNQSLDEIERREK